MHSWNYKKGDSIKAHEALLVYCEMGASRSLEAVGQRLGKSTALIERWSKRHEFTRKAADYDAHMAEIEQRGREKALAKKAEDWATKELEMAALLYDKAKSMLAFPLAKQTTKDGKTIVMPAEWRMRDAASIAEAGVKMERLSRGEATDKITVSIAAKEAIQKIMSDTGLSEEAARAIVAPTFGISEQELITSDRVM